jgi:RsmE family RNA methyltransferase
MDSQSNVRQPTKSNLGDEKLLIVGPEGGFSPLEIEFLHQMPRIRILNLPTPILRTPTAVAAGAGIILGSLLD